MTYREEAGERVGREKEEKGETRTERQRETNKVTA
jgi:hypothetical protein